MLIMGGQKTIDIGRFPILTFYHEQFRSLATRPGARLMVIGYGFGDKHINDIILDGILNHGLVQFIVDPSGLALLDKLAPTISVKHQIQLRLKGISERPLSSTFGGDRVEWSKLNRFLDE